MAQDIRTSSRSESGVHSIQGGDTAPATLMSLRSEETLSLKYVKLHYEAGATTNTIVEVYDEADGTTSGNLEDKVDHFALAPGDTVVVEEGVWRDIEEDILLLPDGNQDGQILVTAGGNPLTG